MKNKILPIISMLVILYFLLALFSALYSLNDDCYFGKGSEATNLKYGSAFLIFFNTFILIGLISFLIKNKSSKWWLMATAISLLLFVLFVQKLKNYQNNIGNALKQNEEYNKNLAPAEGGTTDFAPPKPHTAAQQDSLQKANQKSINQYEINSKKALDQRGCDSLILIENEYEIILQTKGQKSFKLNLFEEVNKNFQFTQDGSGEKIAVKGEKRYQIIGKRFIDNEVDGFVQPFAFSRKLNHPAIADYQVFADFESNFGIAIGLNEGYEMRFKNGKMIIKKQ